MEALQMLKFTMRQNQFHFMQGWITSQKDMMCVRQDIDFLAQLMVGNDFNDIIKMISEQEGNGVAEHPILLWYL